jgi:hypothetical protein
VKRSFLAACAALSLLAAPVQALAWGKEGHAIIALIAQRYMTPRATAAMNALLAEDATDTLTDPDMASRAAWADVWRNSHRETAPWHFVDVEIDGSNDLASACPDGACLTAKLAQYQAVLASPQASRADRITALKFVLHLAADLHQPLHVSDHHDRGGNCVHLTPGGERANLHAYWDGVVVGRLGRDAQAVADELSAEITPSRLRQWQAGDISSWARQTYFYGKRVAYNLQSDAGCDPEGPRIQLSPAYEDAARAATRRLLEMGGVRLARLLNAALG